jgi:hypothetical protein
MGCLFVYPTALVTMIILFSQRSNISYLPLFALGCVLFFIAVARRLFWKGLRNKPVHAMFRVVLGVSFGCVVMAAIIAPTLVLKGVLAIAIIVAWSAYQLGGWYGIKAECRSCPSFRSFPRCEGLKQDQGEGKVSKTGPKGKVQEEVGHPIHPVLKPVRRRPGPSPNN